MNDNMTNEQMDALLKAVPKKPRVNELGGGYYYKCVWATCDEDLRKWYEYCPRCGQKIEWEGIER